MFGTFRKHQTWLWVFIIVVVSLSMVVFFSSDAGMSRGRVREGDFGSINGRPISQEDYFNAHQEVKLAYFFQTGKWPTRDEASSGRLENETISRVFLIHKLNEMDIQVSEKSLARATGARVADGFGSSRAVLGDMPRVI